MPLRVKHIDGIGMRSSFLIGSGSNATGIFSSNTTRSMLHLTLTCSPAGIVTRCYGVLKFDNSWGFSAWMKFTRDSITFFDLSGRHSFRTSAGSIYW